MVACALAQHSTAQLSPEVELALFGAPVGMVEADVRGLLGTVPNAVADAPSDDR